MCAYPTVEHTLLPERCDAVLFDMDGVVTDTAQAHAAAWQRLFDEFFERRAQTAERGANEDLSPFDPEQDYRRYVDGKPRYDGVASLLKARGVELPYGDPDDAPERDTVYGLGKRKNRYFQQWLERQRVTVYDDALVFIRALRQRGIKTGIFSASRNCASILANAGVSELFDARVDGNDLAELGLPGKPDPAMLYRCAERLGVKPERAAVVEDSLAGVRAGSLGGFAWVVGVDRSPGGARQTAALLDAGADRVVRALDRGIAADSDAWRLVYSGYEPDQEGLREALCTLGNGYFASRGAAPDSAADGTHYPGTYLAGGYNRLSTKIAGRTVENEDLVNLPNWLPLSFCIDGGDWFNLDRAEILDYRQTLDLKQGLLSRSLRARDPAGRVTRWRERRLVSMANPHLAALAVELCAENWSGRLSLRSALDGGVVNAGVARYRDLNGRHLETLALEQPDEAIIRLRSRTVQSRLELALAARTRLYRGGRAVPHAADVQTERRADWIGQILTLDLAPDDSVTVEKIVALYTTQDYAIAEPGLAARNAVARAERFNALLDAHRLAWAQLWQRCDISVETEVKSNLKTAINLANLRLRAHIFHLLQTVSCHTAERDAGVPARGWHGEAYRGHIFWDELFIFPYLNLRLPSLTRALLRYRYRRLDAARQLAHQAGYRGAMYPWQSGSSGREESQQLHLNPQSGRWLPDNSYRQRHINAAIAFTIWHYFQVTEDHAFMDDYGAEMLLEIARFWASIVRYNPTLDRYEIHAVMGPDEYHTAYPDSDPERGAGLNNNAYTNVMAAWSLVRALDAIDLLAEDCRQALCQRLALGADELERWDEISRKLRLVFHRGPNGEPIISQFEGYEQLAEFDWKGYRQRYGNIQRLDRILEAEGDSPNRYKASKQADVLMLFYLFSAEELVLLFERLGYPFERKLIPDTIDYYLARTSHGSTLSFVAHCWVLARARRPEAWPLFNQALASDLEDVQGGTTPEGIHLGAMAGSVDLAQRCFTGIEARAGILHFNPALPPEIKRLSATLHYRQHALEITVSHDTLSVRSGPCKAPPIVVSYRGQLRRLAAGERYTFRLIKPEWRDRDENRAPVKSLSQQ